MLIGDTNMDYVRWQNPDSAHLRMVQRTKEEMEPLGFVQIISGVTRTWRGQTDSLIDQCWLNRPQRLISQHNELRGSSDHNMISVIMRTKDKIHSPQVIRKRLWKFFSLTSYREEVKQIDWSPLTQSTDVNFMNNYFEQKLGEILDKYAPMCNVQIRIFFRNWLDNDCKNLMLKRDKQREIAKISDSSEDWSEYKKL